VNQRIDANDAPPRPDEPRLIDVYQDVTGASESAARCAVMFIIFDGRDAASADEKVPLPG
jgi:hypothetical protein